VFPRNTRTRTLAVAPENLATSQASFTAAVVRSVGAVKGAIDAVPVEPEGREAGLQGSEVGRGRPDWWESFTGLVGDSILLISYCCFVTNLSTEHRRFLV
jgi:hypothetical protein